MTLNCVVSNSSTTTEIRDLKHLYEVFFTEKADFSKLNILILIAFALHNKVIISSFNHNLLL